MKDWIQSGTWEKVIEGKSLPIPVSEEIYFEFLNVLPPIEQGKTRADFISAKIPVQEYFLVGEPYSHINNRPVYACFAKAYDFKYFFMGYLHKETSLLKAITDNDLELIEVLNRQADNGDIIRII